MFKLEHTVAEFASALREGAAVEINEFGMWSISKNPLKRWLCKKNPGRHANILATNLLNFFHELERRPIVNSNEQESAWRQTQSLAQASRILEWKLKAVASSKSKDLLLALARCRIAMMYRNEPNQGGYAQEPPYYGLMRALIPDFEEWNQESASEKDSETLKKISCYPTFAQLILKNPVLKDKFYLWAFRDRNPPEVFIQYPNFTESLIACELSFRLGAVNQELIKIQYLPGVQGEEKHLTLLCEEQWVSILNPNEVVVFKGNLKKTVNEIFCSFRDKYKKVGDLEVFYGGVTNWNAFKMGHRDGDSGEIVMIDLLGEKWWEKFPFLEEVSKQQLQERYKTRIRKNEWFACAHATRGQLNLSYEETHAFVEIAYPVAPDKWRILNFGKYGLTFPSNTWEGLKLFTKVMPGGIMYPDENVYYSFRQHGYFPISISAQEGEKLFGMIRHSIFQGFAGHSVYQIESENCAKWTFELFTELVGMERLPNLYQMSLLDTEPGGLMSKLFKFIKRLPNNIHSQAITRLHMPIGAWRGIWIDSKNGRKWVSLSNHRFWNTAEVYLPALLIKKREEGLFEIRSARLDNRTSWTDKHHSKSRKG